MDFVEGENAGGGLAGLFAQHRAELHRFLTARCGHVSEAEDLLQDLWIKLATLDTAGPIANGRAYLFRMANNLVLDRRRSQQRAMTRDRSWLDEEGHGSLPPEDRPDMSEPADEAIARRQEADMLHRAISELPSGAQRALKLYRLDGRNQAEVAQIMGISRSGVEKHLAVAMKHLRNSLADCGHFAAATSQDQKGRGGEPRTERKP
ncbi:MAG: RNA polymerase sigma factor [Novosphingobium sp.]|nr:RNA polymerase sigma factor [Novosphingobium sp.]